jgi:hypothetical protein
MVTVLGMSFSDKITALISNNIKLYVAGGDRVFVQECNSSLEQKWSYDETTKLFQSKKNKKCMESIMNQEQIRMMDCDSDLLVQKWIFP